MSEATVPRPIESRRPRRARQLLAAATGMVALAGCASHTSAESPSPAPSAAATAAKSPTEGPRGYDISYPQGSGPFPRDAAFGIVAVNGRVASEFNPYLKQQAEWAASLKGLKGQPPISYYVHVSNAGAKQSSAWPTTGSNRYGKCHGGDTLACTTPKAPPMPKQI